MAQRDARWDVEPIGENREFVYLAVAVDVFEDFDPIAPLAGRLARILDTFG